MPLIDIQDKITKAIEHNEYSRGIFLDLAKAFDTVDHNIVLTKLKHYGISGVAFDWFSSYLHNRSQQVVCNRIVSKIRTVKFGVPQGSILGPYYF